VADVGRGVARAEVDWAAVLGTPDGGVAVVVRANGDEAALTATLATLEDVTAAPVAVVESGRSVDVLRAAGAGDHVLLVAAGVLVAPQVVERLSWVARSTGADTVSAASTTVGDHAVETTRGTVTWPLHLTHTELAAVVARAATWWSVDVEAPSDQCVLLRRDHLAPATEAGAGTPRGHHVLAPHALVTSTGGPGASRVDGAPAAVTRPLPADAPGGGWRADAIEAAARALADEGEDATVLYVVHGGDPQVTRDERELLATVPGQRVLLLEALDGRELALSERRGAAFHELRTWQADDDAGLDALDDPAYAAFVASVLAEEAVAGVHVRSLVHQPLATVVETAAALGVPVTLSLRDTRVLEPRPATPRADWVARARRVVETADRVVVPTPWLADRVAGALGVDRERFSVVDETAQVVHEDLRAGRERRPGPLRVLTAARWRPDDAPLVRQVAALTGADVEWHVLGEGGAVLADVGAVHGAYTPRELAPLLAELDPDVATLLPARPGAHARTLTELTALGVPVVAADLGALHDRVRAFGGGVLVAPDAPAEIARTLRDVATRSGRAPVPPVSPAAFPAASTVAHDVAAAVPRGRRPVPSIGLISVDAGRGSTSIRLERLTADAERRRLAAFRRVNPADLVSGAERTHFDAILVQRASLTMAQAEKLERLVADEGLRVVVDLDDDLMSPSVWWRLTTIYSRERLEALSRVLTFASHVTVSTPPLADVVDTLCGRPVSVHVPNRLDPRLWATRVPRATGLRPGNRLLYMGTHTHHHDLELLIEPLELVNAGRSSAVVLDVVGVSAQQLPSRHMSRWPVPGMVYPSFVRWMRTHAPQWLGGVAPLVHDDLNASKSDLKLLEYAVAGLPAIATDYGPYSGQHDLALLVDNSPEAWAAAIARVVDDRDETLARQREAARIVARDRTWTPELIEWWVHVLLDRAAS